MENFTYNLLVKSWNSGKIVPILMYHDVDDGAIDLSISTSSFCNQMSWIKRFANPISISDFEILVSKNKHINRPVIITFDDGLRSIYDKAFPILYDLQIPFTVFLVTGLVGKTFTLRNYIKPMLNWEQINKMMDSGLMTLGSHTHSHSILVNTSREQIITELDTSSKAIEQHTGLCPRYFAFPKGKFDQIYLNVVKDYFVLAFSREGLQSVDKKLNYYEIKRVGITNKISLQRLKMTFSPLYWKLRKVRQWLR